MIQGNIHLRLSPPDQPVEARRPVPATTFLAVAGLDLSRRASWHRRRVSASPILKAFLPLCLLLAGVEAFSLAVFGFKGIGVSADTWMTLATASLLGFAAVGAAYWHGSAVSMRIAVSFALFLQMPAALALFSYATTALGASFATTDSLLARIDAAMGVDWLAIVAWFNQSPVLIEILERTYHGTIAMVIYVLVLLNLMGRTRAIFHYFLLVIVTCLVCSGASLVIPALGAFVFFQPDEALRSAIPADAGIWHLQHFEALRAGTFRVFDMSATEGLVTFPSYHTAVALSVPLALRGLGAISGIAWAAATVVVVSTVPIGGHYVIDVIAGAAIAIAADRIIRHVLWRTSPRRAAARGPVTWPATEPSPPAH